MDDGESASDGAFADNGAPGIDGIGDAEEAEAPEDAGEENGIMPAASVNVDLKLEFEDDFVPSVYYKGEAWMPGVKLSKKEGGGSWTEVEREKYEVDYGENVHSGKCTVTATLKSGVGEGDASNSFDIKKLHLSNAKISGAVSGSGVYTYTGEPIKPTIEAGENGYIFKEGTDYTIVEYSAGGESLGATPPSDVGNYTVEIKNINETDIDGDTAKLSYSIEPQNISAMDDFSLEGVVDGKIEWNGGETKPRVLSGQGLAEGEDFDVKYSSHKTPTKNDSKAKAKATITGKGNYTGKKTLTYTITPRNMTAHSGEFEFDAEAVDESENDQDGCKYTIHLTVVDNAPLGEDGQAIGGKPLTGGVDYDVEAVTRYDDAKKKDVTLEKTEYTVSGSAITGLENAGKYTITIKGINNYTGTLTKGEDEDDKVRCGIDISGLRVHIEDKITTYTYDGRHHKPKKYSLYNDDGQKEEDIKYSGKTPTDFTVEYVDLDGKSRNTVDVGTIYVIALGNSGRGYYGRTEPKDEVGSYYEIEPSSWVQQGENGNFEARLVSSGAIYYSPLGTPKPEVEASFTVGEKKVKLEEGKDYKVEYPKDTQNAGWKTVTVSGLGNFDKELNIERLSYYVHPVNIAGDKVECKSDPTVYTDKYGESITLTYQGEILQGRLDEAAPGESGSETLERGWDYVLLRDSGDDGTSLVEEKGKLYVKYTAKGSGTDNGERKIGALDNAKGSGNYYGEREIKVLVERISLGEAHFEGSREEAEEYAKAHPEEAKSGIFYVEWDMKEQIIHPDGESAGQLKPENFEVGYIDKMGQSNTLTKDRDYKIEEDGYGTNNTAGKDKGIVKIKGKGEGSGKSGFVGERELHFTIYTDISRVTTAEESLIKDTVSGGAMAVISDAKWKEIYGKSGGTEAEKASGLLQLAPLFYNEKGKIDPGEYDLEWESGFDPANPSAGVHTVTVVGGQREEHYYWGEKAFSFKITEDIVNASITVNNNNKVKYKGKAHPLTVSSGAISLSVKLNGKLLNPGEDYEVTGYSNNEAIGEAAVYLKGIGEYYEGTAEGHFTIYYPIGELAAFVSNDGAWVLPNNAKYKYTGEQITPDVEFYCRLDVEGDPDPDSEEGRIAESLYSDELKYGANTDAGRGSIKVEGSDYVTGSRTINFTIEKVSIDPEEGDVEYSSGLGDAEDLSVEYMGENYTDESLGITLSYNGMTLSGKDYKAAYKGNRKNVTGDGEKPSVTFTGAGNYKDAHSISFTIEPKDIGGDGVSADGASVEYTDGDPESAILDAIDIKMTSFSGKEIPLAPGRDYEVEGYYTDKECTDEVAVGKKAVKNGRTYHVPQASGEYYIKVAGRGNFDGMRGIPLEIKPRELTGDLEITFVDSDGCRLDENGEPDCTYDGGKHEPRVSVSYSGKDEPLTEGADYDVAYGDEGDNINAGPMAGTVTVEMRGNYTGNGEKRFTIKPKSIKSGDIRFLDESGDDFEDGRAYGWTGNKVQPDLKVVDAVIAPEDFLEREKDYKVEYLDDNEDENTQINAGKVTITITGQGNYTDEAQLTYYIGEDLGDVWAMVGGERAYSTEYNGLSQAPDESLITVGGDTGRLAGENGERYRIAYYKGDFDTKIDPKDMIDAGTYYVSVTGIPDKGTYATTTPEKSCVYTIEPRSIARGDIMVSGYEDTYDYTGSPIHPHPAVEDTGLPAEDPASSNKTRSVLLKKDRDYTLDYDSGNCTKVGKAGFAIVGRGNYTGRKPVEFTILGSGVSGSTGGAGSGGDGSYEGAGSMTDGSVTISPSDVRLGFENSTYGCMNYSGSPKVPAVSISGLTRGDYTVTASNNIAPGLATLTVTGMGRYSGTIVKYFDIRANLGTYGRIVAAGDQVYGSASVPQATVTCAGSLLTEGVDYELSYTNGADGGTATLTATALADSYYTGSVSTRPGVGDASGGLVITGYSSSYTYTGYPITPELTVTMNCTPLSRGTDYTVTYSNNINVGTATMRVDGMGSFTGSKTINFTIEAKNIGSCQASMVGDKDYDGKTYTPAVSVTDAMTGRTLAAGTDYTVTYSNNKNPGTATITVKALGKNYTGTKVIQFKIKSAAVSGLRASKIKNNRLKLAWSEQDYADGYQICNAKNKVVAETKKNSYTVKNLKACTAYRFKVRSYIKNDDGTVSYGDFSTAITARTKLNTPKLKAKSVKRGTVSLSWNKVSKATGYEIYYSTKKNGVYTRLKTIHKASKRSYADTGLARGEKYYYTIRAYRTVNGTKTYSGYNTIKAVRVK